MLRTKLFEFNGIGSPSKVLGRPIRGINSIYCICLYREAGKESTQHPSNEQTKKTVYSTLIKTYCWSTLPAS